MVDFPAMFDDTRKYSGEHTKSYRKTVFFLEMTRLMDFPSGYS